MIQGLDTMKHGNTKLILILFGTFSTYLFEHVFTTVDRNLVKSNTPQCFLPITNFHRIAIDRLD